MASVNARLVRSTALITIALHNEIHLADGDIEDVVRDAARDANGEDVSFHRFDGPIDLVDMSSSTANDPVDLALLPYDLPGMTGIETIAEARDIAPLIKAMIFAPSIDHAADAATGSIEGYLVEPVDTASFERALARILSQIARLHDSSCLINSREGIKRVVYDQVLYCETSGHNQIIHFLDGTTLSTRCSSQSMFDSLSDDKRFFKTGSSYIVNLYEVAQVQTSKGIAVLSDGTELNVPARLRKGLETSLLNIV